MERLKIGEEYSRVDDDIEKERYLREVENSLHKYIRGGVKNKQLDELLKLQIKFQNKYEQLFDVQDLLGYIVDEALKIDQEEIKKFYIKVEYKEDKEDKEELINKILQEELDKRKQKIQEELKNKFRKITKDIAYLSHMNELYNLYEKEENMKRKEKEYEETSEKYEKLTGIMENIQDNKRMFFETIRKEHNVSEDDLDNLLMKNSKYFNIRNNNRGVQISISPEGRKYVEYIEKSKQFYSKKNFNDLLYRNCNNIIESFENSFDKRIPVEPRFDGVMRTYQKILKSKQHEVCAKIISRTEFSYKVNYINNISYRNRTQEIYDIQQNKLGLAEIRMFKKEKEYRNEKIGPEILW